MRPKDSWLDDTGIDALGFEDEPAKERYKYFMRPEPFKDMGAIETEFDIVTGQDMRYRLINIGMVRGATEKAEKKVYLDPLPHIRIEKGKQLQGWYKGKADVLEGKRPRPCFTDAILTEPYGGYCTVGCAFCYINSGSRGYRGSGLITVPQGYGNQIREQLRTMNTSAAGYFSSFTDPFLPLEDYYHNTQQAAQAFVDEGLPIFFLSRLRYPGWAIDMLKKNKYSYAQKSLNTGSDADYKKFSPGALSLDDHIHQVGELRRQGIYTSIQVNPIVPGVTSHEDIRSLFERLAEQGNNHVIVKFVEAAYSWVPAMVDRVTKRFGPERGGEFARLFTQNIGGQKTIDEEYRLGAHRRYQKWATKLGMTYATCYEYRYGDVGKLGVSIGREFITADQCHGHKVPLFTRPQPGYAFAEVKDCPPTGCMYCADDNADKPKCGNETFGSAKALRMADLKQPVYSQMPRIVPKVIPIKKI